jgi:superfamily II DNA or RNA helicase
MIVDRWLTIDYDELSRKEWDKLEAQLSYMTDDGTLVTSFRRQYTKYNYILPRGAWYLLPNHIRYEDRRTRPDLPELNFILKLDDVKRDVRFAGQSDAVGAMFTQEQGLVIRPPGTGKTEIATAFMARAKTRSLVLVHTEDILNQWVERVEHNIPELKGKVGVIRGKTCNIGQITIATVQTLYRSYLDKGSQWWSQWGCVIADEAHHTAAPTWEAVLNACPAHYRFGFTASAKRADGMERTMRFVVGPVIHRQRFTSPVKLEVVPVKTDFRANYRGPFDWGNLLNTLVDDKRRNGEIARIANREAMRENSVLILSRRIAHLEKISEMLNGTSNEILTGKRSRKDRARILKDFRDGKISVLLATQLADEALDVQRLSRVILTFPGKAEGRIIQQIGRALRQHPDKRDALIFDMVDHHVGVLRRQWDERKRTYKSNKISIRGGLLSWRK